MLPPGRLEWVYLQSKRHVLPRRSAWRDDAVPLNGAAAPCALRAVCKCCFKGSKAWRFFGKIKARLNIYSNNKVFTAQGCSLKSCSPMEMDRRGLRAGRGRKRGRLVSAAIFLLLVQLAAVAQRSRCCCDVFFLPPTCLESASECATPTVSVKFTACKSSSQAIIGGKCGATF